MFAIPEVDCKRTGHFQACSLSFTTLINLLRTFASILETNQITFFCTNYFTLRLSNFSMPYTFAFVLSTNQTGTFWRPLLPLCKIIKFLPSTQVYLHPRNQSSYSLSTAFGSTQQINQITLFNACLVLLTNQSSGSIHWSNQIRNVGRLSCVQCCSLFDLLVVFFQWLPFFVEAALERLTREVKESELRTMCLQVVRQYSQ